MKIKKLTYRSCSFLILLSLLLTILPHSVSAADDDYVWILKEVIESTKEAEITEYNTVNAELYNLSVTGAEGSYDFLLNYLGDDLDQGDNGRYFKKGDSASSTVSFSNIPSVIKQDEAVEINLALAITSDTTYDKNYEFLETQGIAFFDKSGAQPDIPSSEAVYFTDNANTASVNTVGTKTGASTSVSATLSATAPQGNEEGQKISICLCASGTIAVGTKYVYEWLPSDEQYNLDPSLKDHVIKLDNINGQILVCTSVNSEYITAESGMNLLEGNTITSEDDSNCVLSFDNGSSINLNKKSEIVLRDTLEKNTKVKLASGSMWAHIQAVSDDGIFKMETEYAVLALHGAIFAVKEGDKSTTVWIFSNTADFTSTVTGEIANLEYGEKAVFDKNGLLTVENFTINDIAEQWSIPLSLIVEDNGYSNVDKFIYVLIIVLILTLITVFLSARASRRRRIRRISKAIPDSDECIFCGKKLEADAMFCPGCGAAVKKKKTDEST